MADGFVDTEVGCSLGRLLRRQPLVRPEMVKPFTLNQQGFEADGEALGEREQALFDPPATMVWTATRTGPSPQRQVRRMQG